MTAKSDIVREATTRERMVGEPHVFDAGAGTSQACRYSAAMLRKRNSLPEDCGDLAARWAPEQRLVTFWRGPTFVAAYRIPDRVMDFDPNAPARALPPSAKEEAIDG